MALHWIRRHGVDIHSLRSRRGNLRRTIAGRAAALILVALAGCTTINLPNSNSAPDPLTLERVKCFELDGMWIETKEAYKCVPQGRPST